METGIKGVRLEVWESQKIHLKEGGGELLRFNVWKQRRGRSGGSRWSQTSTLIEKPNHKFDKKIENQSNLSIIFNREDPSNLIYSIINAKKK